MSVEGGNISLTIHETAGNDVAGNMVTNGLGVRNEEALKPHTLLRLGSSSQEVLVDSENIITSIDRSTSSSLV